MPERVRRSRRKDRYLPLRVPPPEVLQLLSVAVLGPSVAVLLALLALHLVFPAVDWRWLAAVGVPFFGAAVLWGAPGTLAELRGRPGLAAWLIAAAHLLGGVAAAALAFFVHPTAGLLLGLGALAVRAGQEECFTQIALWHAEHLHHRWQRALAVAARGLLPWGLLLAFHPLSLAELAGAVHSFVRGAPGQPLAWLLAGSTRGTVVAALAALVAAHLLSGIVVGARRGQRGWFFDAAEVLVLVFFFALVPPFTALPAYFGFWLGPRAYARWLLRDGAAFQALVEERYLAAAARWAATQMLPGLALLAVAGAALANFWGWHWPEGGVAAFLFFVAASLAPAGCWLSFKLERREGLWRVMPEDD